MTDKQLLDQFASDILPALKAVSKRFAPSIEAVTTDTSLTITASPYIRVLIDGRGPTRSGAKKGSPTLTQAIRAWIDEKSIVPRAGKDGRLPTLDQLAFVISRSIHMHGDLLYQRGGGNNIFDTIITESRLDNLLNLIGEKYFIELKTINL